MELKKVYPQMCEFKPNRLLYEQLIYIGVKPAGRENGECQHQITGHIIKQSSTTLPERPSPLGQPVFPIISYAATLYAVAIGAQELCIIDPINDEVTGYYRRFGFEGPSPYSCRRIALRKQL